MRQSLATARFLAWANLTTAPLEGADECPEHEAGPSRTMQLTVNARLAEINRRFYRSQFL
jgi:hypothetical protein